jgi:hypothetical protein
MLAGGGERWWSTNFQPSQDTTLWTEASLRTIRRETVDRLGVGISSSSVKSKGCQAKYYMVSSKLSIQDLPPPINWHVDALLLNHQFAYL